MEEWAFYCLDEGHNHETREDEVMCSAIFQLKWHEKEIQRLTILNESQKEMLEARQQTIDTLLGSMTQRNSE